MYSHLLLVAITYTNIQKEEKEDDKKDKEYLFNFKKTFLFFTHYSKRSIFEYHQNRI